MTLATGHIGINVTNLERSTTFYEKALGLEAMQTSLEGEHRYAFLGDGERIILTLWDQAGGHYCGTCAGLHHLAFEAPSIEQLDAALERLRSLGAKIHHGGIVAHREGASSGGIFFEDPDGTRLEIFVSSGLSADAPGGSEPTCGFF